MSNTVQVPQSVSNIYSNNGPLVIVSQAQGSVSASTYHTSPIDAESKPICFRWKDSCANFTGRSYELNCLEIATINCQNVSGPKTSKIVAVFGLGGMGKTQLVREFIKQHQKHYKNIIWINAESESSMVDDFEFLAGNCLNISTKVDGKRKDVEILIEEVFNKLSTSATIIVFDNVDETKNTKTISFVLTSGIRPHIIITSRIQSWDNYIHHIHLNVFNDNDALQYVSNNLKSTDENDSEDDKMKLVKTLQNFPLALTQAVAHINDRRLVEAFHISDYLLEWESSLDSTFFQKEDLNTYKQTTLTTWNVTTAAIKRYGAVGDLAIRILQIISYFDPNHIRRDIFFNLNSTVINVQEVHNKTEVISAVRLLVNYSMVDSLEHQSLLSIHRLVQQVTKIGLESNADSKKSILRDSLDIIWKMRQHPNYQECLDHGISVFLVAITCEELIHEHTEFAPSIILNLNDCGKYMRAMSFGLEVFEKLTAILGDRHSDVLECELNIASSYLFLCKYTEAFPMYQKVLDKQKKTLGENHPKTLKTESNIVGAYQRLGKYAEAIQVSQSVFEKLHTILGPNHAQTLTSQSNMGLIYHDMGKFAVSLKILQEVFEKRRTILGQNHARTLISKTNIGLLYNETGKFFVALQIHREVFEKRKTISGEYHPRTLQSESYLAETYNNLGEYSRALQQHQTVYEKRQTMPAEYHLKLHDSMSHIAITYSRLGRHSEALQMLQTVFGKLKSLLGEDHQKTLDNLSHIAAAFSNIGKHCEALEEHRKLFEKWKHKLGIDHPHTLVIHFNLAVCYSCMGEHSTALEMHQEVLRKRREILGNDHPHTLDSKFRIAILQNTMGDHSLALTMHLEVHQERMTVLGKNHPDTLNSLSNIADSHNSMGNVFEALQLHEEAFAQRKITLGESHPHTLNSMSKIAASYSFQGEYSRAIQMYSDVLEKHRSILGDDHPETQLSSLLMETCKEDMRAISFCSVS